MHLESTKLEWVVDTTTSYFATLVGDLFCRSIVGDFGSLKIGNRSYSKIVGIRDISINTNARCTLILKNMHHISDLWLNLISKITIDQDG